MFETGTHVGFESAGLQVLTQSLQLVRLDESELCDVCRISVALMC